MSVNQETLPGNQPELQAEFKGARFVIIAGHFDYFGGAERQAVLLAKELIHRYEAHVQFLGWGGNGIFADEIRAVGGIPRVFPMDLGQRGLQQKLTLLRLSRFIRKELKPEYLLPFVGMHCKVIGSIWKLTGARFCWWNQRDEGRLIHGTRTERRLLATLPAVVSNSSEGRDFLIEKFGLSADRVRVINNGVEIPALVDPQSWRSRLNLGADDFLMTMVANLTAYKDHVTLLNAFAQVYKEISPLRRVCLVLAGSHCETAVPLKELAFDLGLCGAVHMPGIVRDIENLLAASDLVVHSSIKEGCPNAVLEGMAAGKCVVGTDMSGIRHALGDKAADIYLAPPGDSARLAVLMRQMAEDPIRRAEAGRANRNRIETEFSVERMTQAVLQTILDHRIP